jgi:hypothetical protein
MKRTVLITVVFFFVSVSLVWPQGIRKAVWAGKFYDSSPTRLASHIDSMLQQAGQQTLTVKDLKAVIAPHAGYVYSGPVAGFAYRLIQGHSYDSVIIIGTAHRHGLRGCSIYSRGGYQTPLGVAYVDESLARELSKASGFRYIPEAHRQEHSIEVQVPFIQKALPGTKIVPVLMGFPSKETIFKLAKAFRKVLPSKNVLIIVSTDMSHYYPKAQAKGVDTHSIELLQSQKVNLLIEKLANRENIMCGGGGVASALLYAQAVGQAQVEILRYADSSAAGGPDSQVVGYLAAAIYSKETGAEFVLPAGEKKELLNLAITAIEVFLRENRIVEYKPQSPILFTQKGAFVTLKKGGRLRGCIGYIEPVTPLFQTVIQAAIFSASKDARFPPVSASEIKELEIEISVLSPLRKISDPDLILVGKHGLVIVKDEKKGLLLPQVPVQNHWSRETFLQQACLKAGLSKYAWETDADIFIFEAIVFH